MNLIFSFLGAAGPNPFPHLPPTCFSFSLLPLTPSRSLSLSQSQAAPSPAARSSLSLQSRHALVPSPFSRDSRLTGTMDVAAAGFVVVAAVPREPQIPNRHLRLLATQPPSLVLLSDSHESGAFTANQEPPPPPGTGDDAT
ncbi:hypothetical protein RIF29_38207 [Crotalaria pallida]|uniref:Uncharacterized protein n=1 Tax=Crotalaria pallida TaxID=3830 RepID=A0AAN9E555_CROPI